VVTTVGGVAIEIRGDDAHFNRTMREVRGEAGRTGQVIEREFRSADQAAGKLNNTLKSTASSMLALGVAVGVGAGLSGGVRLIADFSQAMSTLQAITQGTAEEMVALRAVANELGATTRFSATQAADAMTELARAGFSVNQVLAAIGPTLSAAQAGGAGIAETAAIIGASIGGFGLQASDAARIADVLAQAANGSAAGILDLGEALKFAAPTAKQLGLGLEETVAIIGKLSDGGITGGLAGRGFQSLATQLVNEKDKIEDLIGTYDLASEGLGSVLARLREAGITTAQIIEIFRAENLDTFGILSDAALNGNLEKLNGLLDDAAGSSAKAAKVMDDNLNGAILNASSAFEGLVLAIADAGIEDGLRNAFVGLSGLLTLAADNVDVLGVAVVAVAANALIPMAVRAIPAAVGALRTLAVALTTTQTAAARLAAVGGLLGGPLTLGIIAASAAYIVLARNAERAEQRLERANTALAGARDILRDTQGLLSGNDSPLSQIADQAGEAVSEVVSLTGALDGLAEGIKNLREEGQIATALKLGEALAATDASIKELEAQRTRAGGRAFNQLNLGGQAGLQRNIDRELANFDQSEEGKALLQLKQERAALQNRLRVATEGLSINDLVNQFRSGNPAQGSPAATTTEAAAEIAASTDDTLQSQLALLTALEREEALRLAIAAGNQELVDILETNEAINERTLDYIEAGLSATDARAKAETFITTEKQAQADLAKREADEAARKALSESRAQEIRRLSDNVVAERDAADAALRDGVARNIAQGLEQGIRDGNWGEAFREVLAQSTADALTEAVGEIAGVLTNLLGGVLNGVGSSVGSSLGTLFAFGGARAGGGNVRAGSRYMVGEKGPEMFVPTVPGMVLPKFEGPASMAAGGLGGGGINVTAPFIVQGNVTEDVLPRVQRMLADQARELPRIVNTVIQDGQRRGRY
jgi:TP901 family phage tail tape measure protein